MERYWTYRTSGDDMAKPIKKVGSAINRGARKLLSTFDKEVTQRQVGWLKDIGNSIVGKPKIVQEEAPTQPTGVVDRQRIRPLAALGESQTENQEAATRELYRRRRARGVATSPMGVTGQASVQRKTLLGS